MVMLKYTVVGLVVVVLTGCRAVTVNSCTKNPTDDINIKSFNIDPSPIQVPGSLSLALAVDVRKSIEGNLRADVIIRRKLGPVWIPVPCFNNVGSCTYTDVCSLLRNLATNGCPAVLTAINLTCSCPVAAGTYTLPHQTFHIDTNTVGISTSILAGQYQANVRLTDANTHTEIACFDVAATLTQPPSSSTLSRFFSGLFGG
ncbi:hypothetical protein BsWGS_12205 [Bradybaena similaris]